MLINNNIGSKSLKVKRLKARLQLLEDQKYEHQQLLAVPSATPIATSTETSLGLLGLCAAVGCRKPIPLAGASSSGEGSSSSDGGSGSGGEGGSSSSSSSSSEVGSSSVGNGTPQCKGNGLLLCAVMNCPSRVTTCGCGTARCSHCRTPLCELHRAHHRKGTDATVNEPQRMTSHHITPSADCTRAQSGRLYSF
jgi:hypothetical protein